MRLLILGTGGMATSHAMAFGAIHGVRLVGAVDVDKTRAEAFAAPTRSRKSLPRSMMPLLGRVRCDRQCHARQRASSDHDGAHQGWQACFCEKPLAENHAKALEMTEAAERAGLVNMVNLTYRNVAAPAAGPCHGGGGRDRRGSPVEASYLAKLAGLEAVGRLAAESKWLWRLSTAHGSTGALGDIGIHIVDFAAYGAARILITSSAVSRPSTRQPATAYGDYVLDANDGFAMSVSFVNGAIGVIHASRYATGHINELRLRVHGTPGALEVIHRMDGSMLRACIGPDVEKGEWRKKDCPPVDTNYQRFARAVAAGTTKEPSFRRAADMQRVLDRAMASAAAQRDLVV